MRYEIPFLFTLVGIGLATRRLTVRSWFFTGLFVFAFILVNWLKG